MPKQNPPPRPTARRRRTRRAPVALLDHDDSPFAGRGWRALAATGRFAVLTVLVCAIGAFAPLFAVGQLGTSPTEPGSMRVRSPIVAIDGNEVHLKTNASDLHLKLVDGVWQDGRIRLTGEPRHLGGGVFARPFEVKDGPVPPIDIELDLDEVLFDADDAIEMGAERVIVDGELGPLPAWLFDHPGPQQPGRVWFIHTHGHSQTRTETLRLIAAMGDRLWPSLSISVRGDGFGPTDDVAVTFGFDESRDVIAAMEWVRATHDPQASFVLVGYSQGGSASLFAAADDSVDGWVEAIVLDSPLLSLRDTVCHLMQRELGEQYDEWTGRLCGLAARSLESFADLPLAGAEHASRPPPAPTLVLQGDRDSTTPHETARRWYRDHPGSVFLLEYPGSRHTRLFNDQPEAYVLQIDMWLQRLGFLEPSADSTNRPLRSILNHSGPSAR